MSMGPFGVDCLALSIIHYYQAYWLTLKDQDNTKRLGEKV
jgi:hypothetical protein